MIKSKAISVFSEDMCKILQYENEQNKTKSVGMLVISKLQIAITFLS